MKIKLVKRNMIVGYDVRNEVEVFDEEVKKFDVKNVVKVCESLNVEGKVLEKICENEGVIVIGCSDGDVEYIGVKV